MVHLRDTPGPTVDRTAGGEVTRRECRYLITDGGFRDEPIGWRPRGSADEQETDREREGGGEVLKLTVA